jgi:hypothetical protein
MIATVVGQNSCPRRMAKACRQSYPVFTYALWMFGGQLRSGNSAAVADGEVRKMTIRKWINSADEAARHADLTNEECVVWLDVALGSCPHRRAGNTFAG